MKEFSSFHVQLLLLKRLYYVQDFFLGLFHKKQNEHCGDKNLKQKHSLKLFKIFVRENSFIFYLRKLKNDII